jgi:hypothetical protein
VKYVRAISKYLWLLWQLHVKCARYIQLPGAEELCRIFCARIPSLQLSNKLLHICECCYERYASRVHSTFLLGILYQYCRHTGAGGGGEIQEGHRLFSSTALNSLSV